eukprot:CAMPEP_0197682592 /NCGR_PEP_ID=MMETSP1338-20131121/96705_1 /TAXON_ID=43686 ORGANISM="Pelagodinium beii, Strain RCC1491" /NCGR_SAMPLE_ID=MMETSP1338 /ASSEMBLY_ACC=CAM_ASM_000754 /LENGTH=77 /DNA_ID=CAMNT_0043264069 /DNA_START=72 /DNA_END=302 /DNA_ORIENTATION=+
MKIIVRKSLSGDDAAEVYAQPVFTAGDLQEALIRSDIIRESAHHVVKFVFGEGIIQPNVTLQDLSIVDGSSLQMIRE